MDVTFYFPLKTEYAVTVEVEDPSDYDQVDEALDKAYDMLPDNGGPYITGPGWNISVDPTDIEAERGVTADGKIVWGEIDNG